ncbi:unnamed protein product [Arctia plantaginis]|uniref:U5 small nuclear ribonucleoprotein TSSC4 n=1 Tax=Arctia plantaginis TaxID=874455 RepID=A0A8S0ZYG5_ARCPL|nr:unnamed protein product [Arctia plantaginis]CAB3238053.1 unnamed protein product [Arctia plantaginis]
MSSFHERQKSLFNQLKDAEEQCGFSKTNKKTQADDYGSIDRRTYRKLKHEMKQFRGRESIFKRAEANIRECLRAKTIPDHIKNPNKWVYYSLADVTQEQMSDATNTATALALIREMEDKATQPEMECDFDETGVFKKPSFRISSTIKKAPLASVDDKVVFKSNKVVMPEYVVGVTKKVEKKNTSLIKKVPKKCEKNAELKLDHLFEEEE